MTQHPPKPENPINEETIVAFAASGAQVQAHRLQVWAYRRLELFPELLAALKDMLEVLGPEVEGDGLRCIADAKAAIAKAEAKEVTRG